MTILVASALAEAHSRFMENTLVSYDIIEVDLVTQTAVVALVEISQGDDGMYKAHIHFGLETEEHEAESLDELDFYIHSATPGFLRVDLVDVNPAADAN